MKARIVISGDLTYETTLPVASFPIHYEPVQYLFGQMQSSVAGVAVNLSCALKKLGHDPHLLGVVGQDIRSKIIQKTLEEMGLNPQDVVPLLETSTQSLIAYNPEGKRMIYCDLKEVQNITYPKELAENALNDADLAILCNLNYVREFLPIAKEKSVPIVTDVHVLTNPDDAYNRDFLMHAHTVFMSHEGISGHEKSFAHALFSRYPIQELVMGCGAEGALWFDHQTPEGLRASAKSLRPVINTIGAGDALLAAFMDGRLQKMPPLEALQRACYFAGWKVGEKGAAQGFLTQAELDKIQATKQISQ